jgi:branched-chain amino acid transport system substrate-binding protein
MTFSRKPYFDRRRFLVGTAASGTALMASGLYAPALAQTRTIKIGYVTPKTGPLSLFSEADDLVIAGARDAFGGGLSVGGKSYPVEIITRDTQSNSNRASEVTVDLINEGVDLVVVSSAPETVNPVSDQCELNGVPCISTVAPWQAWTFGRGGNPVEGFDYTFHFFWGLEDIVGVFSDMWDTLQTNKQAAGLFPNDEDGRAWADDVNGAPALLNARGYSTTKSGFYRPLNDDFSSIITTFKDADCQLITGAPIPPDFTTFWTQARQQGFRPKAASIAKAILFPAAVEALGEAAHNLSSEIWWSPSHPYVSSLNGLSCSDLGEVFQVSTGKQWTQPIGFAHALFEIAADVFKRTEELGNHEATTKAISETVLDTIVGRVDWLNTPIKNVSKTALVGGQWRLSDGPHDLELVITSNEQAKDIPVAGEFEELT